MVRIKYLLLRIVDYFIGHDWSEWGVFSYVPEGGTGFATVSDTNSRQCERCYAKEYRDWSDAENMQLMEMQIRFGSKLNGFIGTSHGVRFVDTVVAKHMVEGMVADARKYHAKKSKVLEELDTKEIKKAIRTLKKHKVK